MVSYLAQTDLIIQNLPKAEVWKFSSSAVTQLWLCSCLLTSWFNSLPSRNPTWKKEWMLCMMSWVEQGLTAPQEIEVECRTALEGRTKIHAAHSSTSHWCHLICFIPYCSVFYCPLGVSDNKQNNPNQSQRNWCKHFNTGGNKNWIICCCYFRWDKL